jgi:hypothetical protein
MRHIMRDRQKEDCFGGKGIGRLELTGTHFDRTCPNVVTPEMGDLSPLVCGANHQPIVDHSDLTTRADVGCKNRADSAREPRIIVSIPMFR